VRFVRVRIARWDRAAFRAACKVLSEEGVRPDDAAGALDGGWFPVAAGSGGRVDALAAKLGSIPGVVASVSE
jgi:hypothetical protein